MPEGAFAFALSLSQAAPDIRAAVGLESMAANELAITPQVMLGLFTPSECGRIIAVCEARPLQRGGLVQERENYRLARAGWIAADENTNWIYGRIAKLAARLNRWYRYDLFGFLEPLHFIRYDTGGKFDWHLDCGGNRTCTRKLSITVQLTAPQEYDGGALEFCPQGELHRSRYHGAATIFPSMLAHRVTPVTRGVRHAIVGWIHGPSFR